MNRLGLIALGLAALTGPVAAQYVSEAEPFITAVKGRNGDKATQLLDNRPSLVNSRNTRGEIALNIAIARQDDTWMRFLLGKGADVNLAASTGDTPLITAARVGFADAVELLLRRGAKVDAANKMGETALIVAVQQRQLEAVKLLLAKGANPDRPDNAAGYTARDYAKRDTRAREILAAIEAAKKPAGTPSPKKDDSLDSFKLGG